ncbi:hypothetical protein Dsin_014696 [Dipteronia sinensis]|uniref:Reverse transcriptase zinc-binding domain-containing protein n=1 Tax=Dipteronia sinensis TaxID=43782 RepID=A0AAE0AMI6_9ROSI|nr:hypothetical protein Dsin_014696 [Dipteronia sinensis]
MSFFLDLDKELICSIPVDFQERDDCLSWHFDKTGSYTVKSGYKVAMDAKCQEASSNLKVEQQWWLSLWNLKIPLKVKVFAWKACLNGLPCLINLRKRNVLVNPICHCCNLEEETLEHALFWC